MNISSESYTKQDANESTSGKILVWDAPIRIFHWLMVFSFAGAYLTAESDQWRLLHITLGYTMAGLVVFRIIWGLIGTRYARFRDFVSGPKKVAAYIRALMRGKPEHYTGHNPAGAIAIIGLLALTVVVAVSGWATYQEVAGHWIEEFHEVAANIMLGLIGLHVAGVLIASRLHHENLIGAMISGRKPGKPEKRIHSAWRSVAVLMLVAVLSFWFLQWRSASPDGVLTSWPVTTSKHGAHHDDDD